MTIGQIKESWNRFFYDPISPAPMGCYRICLGAVALMNYLLLAPDLMVWYGLKGTIPIATGRMLAGGTGLSVFPYLPQTDASVRLVFGLGCASAITLMLGFFTRTSAALLFLTLVSIDHRNVIILNGGDSFLRVAIFFTIFSEAGKAYSVDRLIRVAGGVESGPPSPLAPWAQRLIAIQVAFVYFYTFAWKAMGPMWLAGTAIYYTTRLTEFWRFHVPYLFEHLWTIKLWTWGTLIVEFSMGVLVWVKELRYWVLLTGVLLHLGIDYSMNIPLFAPIMVSAYLTFVDPPDLDRALGWFRSLLLKLIGNPLPLPIFYDGKCSFCQRSVAVIERLNILRRLMFYDMHKPATREQFHDFDAKRGELELLVKTRAGDWLGGFEAFRFFSRALPLVWIILPFLYLPGAKFIGNAVYTRIAARRTCLVQPRPADKRPAGTIK